MGELAMKMCVVSLAGTPGTRITMMKYENSLKAEYFSINFGRLFLEISPELKEQLPSGFECRGEILTSDFSSWGNFFDNSVNSSFVLVLKLTVRESSKGVSFNGVFSISFNFDRASF